MWIAHQSADRNHLFGATTPSSLMVSVLSCLALFAFATDSPAQSTRTPPQSSPGTALVTFFTNEFDLTGDLSGQDSLMFPRELWVDHDQLAYMTTGTFVTIKFLPGHYQFSASFGWAFGPKGGAHLDMNLIAGQHYFVQTQANVSVPFYKNFSIKEVTCEEANKEANQKSNPAANGQPTIDDPLGTGHLRAAAKGNVVTEHSFPRCSNQPGALTSTPGPQRENHVPPATTR